MCGKIIAALREAVTLLICLAVITAFLLAVSGFYPSKRRLETLEQFQGYTQPEKGADHAVEL